MESMILSMLRGGASHVPTVVFVEGNIGSGKTEVMAAMKDWLKLNKKQVIMFTEETEVWEHEHLLQDHYARPNERAAKRAFEALGPLRQYIERAHFIEKCGSEYDYIIMEKHPTTTLEVFGADKAVRALFETVHASRPFMDLPKTTVYVKASPATCLERIIKRDREAERSFDSVFIKGLSDKYGTMMLGRREAGHVVISVDSNRMAAAEVADEACKQLLAL